MPEERVGDIPGLIEAWSGLAVVSRYDRETEAWIFIALHDDTLGPPVGGTRMKVYPHPAAGLRDALRLAEGMTHKWAVIDLDSGGGKAVLALSRSLHPGERRGLLERYAALLNSLRGCFSTGEDLGTTPDDMLTLARLTPYVHGYDAGRDTVRDPGPYTALGVFSGMRAAALLRFGDEGLSGRSVLVQGAGDVGAPLARLCAKTGAELLISDVDEARVAVLVAELGAKSVPPSDVYTTACDVYAPCAIGATLNPETTPKLDCRIVAGSANNQLGGPSDAQALHERGILYVPDYVVNAGGALAFGLLGRGHAEDAALRDRVASLGGTVSEILEEAARNDESPLHAARRRIERTLARGKGGA